MKKRIIITEDDKKHILNLYSVDVVSEQVNLNWRWKQYNIRKGKISNKQISTEGDVKVTKPENEWDAYLQGPIAKIFRSYMDGKSLELWRSEVVVNEKPFAVGVLEEFERTYEDKKLNKVRVSKSTEKVVIPGSKQEFASIPVMFPSTQNPNAPFFVDNYYEVTDLFKTTVESDIVKPVQEQMSTLNPPPGKPKAYLKELKISSSCSTLPNTESPDGKTYSFQELSKLRNDTAKEYIIEKLKTLGVGIDENTKITQDSNGTNAGNLLGTSGPDWSKLSDSEKNRRRKEFDKYKYLVVESRIIFNDTISPDPIVVEPQIIYTNDYYVTMYRYQKPIKLRIPIPSISFGGKRMGVKKATFEECPYFNK